MSGVRLGSLSFRSLSTGKVYEAMLTSAAVNGSDRGRSDEDVKARLVEIPVELASGEVQRRRIE